MEDRLPKKLGDLLALAMEDYDKVLAQPGLFRIGMGTWVAKWGKEPCVVCLGGAVMIGTLGAAIPRGEICPSDIAISIGDRDRLYALNALRLGFISAALSEVHSPTITGRSTDYPVPSHYNDPTGWRIAMDDLIAELRSRDL